MLPILAARASPVRFIDTARMGCSVPMKAMAAPLDSVAYGVLPNCEGSSVTCEVY